LEPVAVAWALDEAEAELRQEPAHRLIDAGREYAWSMTAPNGIGVNVEAVRVASSSVAAVEFNLVAGADGLLRHARAERRVTPPLDGVAARVPGLLYLVFETGGQVHAFETLQEPGGEIETWDLEQGRYLGAFSDQGEVIKMSPGDEGRVRFSASGQFDMLALETLMGGCQTFSELAGEPHKFALAIWRSS